MTLTAGQISQYHEAGYLILPAVFSTDEIARMRSEADRMLEQAINCTLALGTRNYRLDVQIRDDKLNVRKLQPVNDLSEYIAEVSNDERLIGPMRQLMNDEPVLMEEKLNYKQLIHQPLDLAPFETKRFEDSFPLHHDWGYYRQQGYPENTLSSAISIDDSTAENGPLRVVPRTHTRDWPLVNPDPASGDGRVPEEIIPEDARIPCLAPAGSVMLFHSKLLHDSCPNNSGRPRRIMIYSHYPAEHKAERDQRNRYGREKAHEQEARYRRMVELGDYEDRFHVRNEPQA